MVKFLAADDALNFHNSGPNHNNSMRPSYDQENNESFLFAAGAGIDYILNFGRDGDCTIGAKLDERFRVCRFGHRGTGGRYN